MKYASVVIPLVIVGVVFLLGCVWVATRGSNDDGDEESVLERDSSLSTAKQEHPVPEAPSRAHPVSVPAPPLPISTHSTESPPSYER